MQEQPGLEACLSLYMPGREFRFSSRNIRLYDDPMVEDQASARAASVRIAGKWLIRIGAGSDSSVLPDWRAIDMQKLLYSHPMRDIIKPQLQLGEQDIGAITMDAKSRDDIPRLLRGLQVIYTTLALREQVFAILAEVLPQRARRGDQTAACRRPEVGRAGARAR